MGNASNGLSLRERFVAQTIIDKFKNLFDENFFRLDPPKLPFMPFGSPFEGENSLFIFNIS
jgi:hypothetical protein